MPVLDPYFIDNHKTNYENGLLRGYLNASNVRTYGFKKSHFLSVKPELINDFFHLEIDMEVPKMLIEGEYDADGSLGTFQIGGTGICFTSSDTIITRISKDTVGSSLICSLLKRKCSETLLILLLSNRILQLQRGGRPGKLEHHWTHR